jgi:aminoglycoside phosphotransferase (APT) family kinase protein
MADDETEADINDVPWRRDPAELRGGFARWVASEFGADAELVELAAPDGNGMSSETVLFDVRDSPGAPLQRFAARLGPPAEQFPVFPTYDLEVQKRAMDIVRAETDVPTPESPWLVSDEQWLGSPFLVMRRIDGIAPSDIPPYVFEGWVLDAEPELRAALQKNAIETIAKVHTISGADHDLSFLSKTEFEGSPLRKQLAYQHWYYEWAREAVHYPLIERTLQWLDDNFPAETPPVLTWGDARIGNMLFQGSDVVAALDWEMATVGPAEVDVAWTLFLARFFQDLAERFEFTGLPDFMPRAEVIEQYEAASGRTLEPLEWFEVFAALRFATVSIRTSTRAVAYGAMEMPAEPDDFVMFRGLLEEMLAGTYWKVGA